MTFNRAGGDEQSLGDLAVREPLTGEFSNPALAGRQRVETSEKDTAWARTGGAQLGLGLFGEWFRSGTVGGVDCLVEQFSRVGAPIAPSKHRAEVSLRAGSLQSCLTVLESLNRRLASSR